VSISSTFYARVFCTKFWCQKLQGFETFWCQNFVQKIKALRKTAFAEIFVFASFGNVCFSKIRVGASFSSFFRTRLDSRKLVPTLIFAKNRKKSRFFAFLAFASFGNSLLPKLPKVTKKLVSSRLAKTRSDAKTDSKFRVQVRNAGPYKKCARKTLMKLTEGILEQMASPIFLIYLRTQTDILLLLQNSFLF